MQAGFALGTQAALRRGKTHGEQLAVFFRKVHVPMLFQQCDEHGQERQEPFGTYVVARLPAQKQGLLHLYSFPEFVSSQKAVDRLDKLL